MTWEVKIHPLVFSEDFKDIDNADAKMIVKAIRKKLSVNPMEYGSPLKNNLKGLCKLRVDFYRVIYQVNSNKIIVLVAKVGKRKDFEVYDEVPKRMKRIADEQSTELS
ncbi:MAG: type II toxin-antitoxin system RelE/ParE family toxin [Candidatus Firestonebacteria bacterium]|nr:type II toxin-antitoxin system RelE/ParE family toxin [Candidatus Firestonebacteria bacterium]